MKQVVEILPSSRSSTSVSLKQNVRRVTQPRVHNMIREELTLVKQNGGWKPRRKKRIIWPFLPSKWVKFSVLLIKLICFVDPSPLLFYFYFFFIRSESIRVDPTRTSGPSWFGPTFVPACNFIINSKIHSRKITSNEYFKGTLHYFRVNALSGLMVDRIDLWSRAETGQSLIWLISHIARRGKNQFIVGLPQCNMNSKLHISGKSKVLMVKSRTEMHFQKNKHILLAEGCKIVYEVRHQHREIFFYLDFRSHFLL